MRLVGHSDESVQGGSPLVYPVVIVASFLTAWALALLDLDASAFNEQVVADGNIDIPTKAYCTPVGAALMPTDMSELDLGKWKLVHEDLR
jgi:hypothetical protein